MADTKFSGEFARQAIQKLIEMIDRVAIVYLDEGFTEIERTEIGPATPGEYTDYTVPTFRGWRRMKIVAGMAQGDLIYLTKNGDEIFRIHLGFVREGTIIHVRTPTIDDVTMT